MKNRLILIALVLFVACTNKSGKQEISNNKTETFIEQISNNSDLLFGEAEDLFIEGKKNVAAQKLSEGIRELKKELKNTAGVTKQRIDSTSFFLEELVEKLEEGSEEITEVQLVSALYKAQLMTAHDYLVSTAQYLDKNELDSAQVSIIHATTKMINGIDRAQGQPKSTLQQIHSETEALLNNLENKFQKDVTQIRHKLEKLRLRLKELENHIDAV